MNLLIVGDTNRTPELRHEVPLGIPDPFFYAELDGRRVVAISAMEAARVEALGTSLEVRPVEEFGAVELSAASASPTMKTFGIGRRSYRRR